MFFYDAHTLFKPHTKITICKQLGFQSGKYLNAIKTTANSLRIGRCSQDDINNDNWPVCSAGGNSLIVHTPTNQPRNECMTPNGWMVQVNCFN